MLSTPVGHCAMHSRLHPVALRAGGAGADGTGMPYSLLNDAYTRVHAHFIICPTNGRGTAKSAPRAVPLPMVVASTERNALRRGREREDSHTGCFVLRAAWTPSGCPNGSRLFSERTKQSLPKTMYGSNFMLIP